MLTFPRRGGQSVNALFEKNFGRQHLWYLNLESNHSVSYGSALALNPIEEDKSPYTQSFHGIGCRPVDRLIRNIFELLQNYFPFVYVSASQPWHNQFPLDWTKPPDHGGLVRAIFVGSKTPQESIHLVPFLPKKQTRH